MNNSDKFVVIGRNEEGNIVTVVNVVGGTFEEIEKISVETAEKTHLKYEILQDETLFNVVYHFESQYNYILENIRLLYNNTFLLNKVVVENESKNDNVKTEETNSEEKTEIKEVNE